MKGPKEFYWAEEGFCHYPQRQRPSTTFEGDDEDELFGPQLLHLNQAAAGCGRNRLRTAQHVEFGENALEMGLHSRFADE